MNLADIVHYIMLKYITKRPKEAPQSSDLLEELYLLVIKSVIYSSPLSVLCVFPAFLHRT